MQADILVIMQVHHRVTVIPVIKVITMVHQIIPILIIPRIAPYAILAIAGQGQCFSTRTFKGMGCMQRLTVQNVMQAAIRATMQEHQRMIVIRVTQVNIRVNQIM